MQVFRRRRAVEHLLFVRLIEKVYLARTRCHCCFCGKVPPPLYTVGVPFILHIPRRFHVLKCVCQSVA